MDTQPDALFVAICQSGGDVPWVEDSARSRQFWIEFLSDLLFDAIACARSEAPADLPPSVVIESILNTAGLIAQDAQLSRDTAKAAAKQFILNRLP